MTVGLKVDFLWYPIGTGDFFYSFFSTVCVNLECSNWGGKFPILMNNLYNGLISYEYIDKAIEEISEIEIELRELSSEKMIWDFENRAKNPPWGMDISDDINNLLDYFVTSDGENLIHVLKNAFNEAKIEKVDIEVKLL